MKKSLYILICLFLALGFWNTNILNKILSRDVLIVINWIWIISGIFFFTPRTRMCGFRFQKYLWIIVLFILGIFFATLNAYFFWDQDILITFFSQRGIYSLFLYLPVFLYIQPSIIDIKKALRVVSYITFIFWLISVVDPGIFIADQNYLMNYNYEKKNSDYVIGLYVSGIHLTVFYFYFTLSDLIKRFNWNHFLESIFLFSFILLYQNRSLLIGASIILFYSLLKIKTRYKAIIITASGIFLLFIIITTFIIWKSLFFETVENLNDNDYNRWVSFYYYLNSYSPNWFCFIFGNGFPSGGNSQFGNLYFENFKKGIFASDLGLMGMWVDYGILTVGVFIFVFTKVLTKNHFPMELKFISAHMFITPTIFHFWENTGVILFSFILYFFVYYELKNRRQKLTLKLNAGNNNSKLQKRN